MAERTYFVCFLKKFNNYFNRIIKGYSTLEEYQNASEDFYLFNKPINWNPKDNVSTELIMNDCPFDADYLLILDEESNIVSRWFIMETVFTRNQQYRHDLRRDVIYDNLEKLMLSPVYVEKGWLKDSDPFIFNPEGMNLNEIKKDETLLKDDTGGSYIVGYIAKNATASDISVQIGAEDLPDSIDLETIASDLGISASDLNNLINFNNSENNPAYFTNRVEVRYGYSTADLIPFLGKQQLFFTPDFSSCSIQTTVVSSWAKTLYKLKSTLLEGVQSPDEINSRQAIIDGIIANKSAAVNSMESIFGRIYLTEEHLSKLQKYIGKIVKYNNKYYKLQLITRGVNEEAQGPAVYTSFGGISTGISQGASTSQFTDAATFHPDGEISVRVRGTLSYINLNDETIDSSIPAISTKIPTTRNANNNNNYDLFVIPFSPVQVGSVKTSPDIAQRVASAIAAELDAACYDVQLLPYFPWPDIVKSGIIDLTNLTTDVDYVPIFQDFTTQVFTYTFTNNEYTYLGSNQYKTRLLLMENVDTYQANAITCTTAHFNGGASATTVYSGGNIYADILLNSTLGELTPEQLAAIEIKVIFILLGIKQIVSYMFFPKSDSFRSFINQSLSLKDSVKIESECNKYRLCSPNYQGSFDFNVAKNGGSVDYFIAECTYKPYTPYIKVVPQFKLLYGANFSDARGLICGGDYSLSRFTDAWESFELQNKNYQNIFNREIQNLDINQQLNWERSLITGGLGIATGGAVGAVGGVAASGSPWGALAGGILGTAGSAIGMKFDIDMLHRQQRETKQFAIDKYNYQLGNIKALPYTLTKIGAFNINSKIWPFIEYYTCTDEEKDALEKKLQYESMTVMRIALFGDFWGVAEDLKYFKGQLIRNEEIAEDNHIFEAIYTEIAKGVYM